MSNDPNGTSSVTPQHQQQQQPQFKMQRASTQLSISLNHHNQQHHQQNHLMRGGGLNKHFGSSHDLKLPEVKTIEKKNAEKMKEIKKTRAPPPPTNGNNAAAVNQNSNMIRTKVRDFV